MRGAALLVGLFLAAPASAALSERDLARAGAHPPAEARLPAALAFRDGRGRMVTLGQVAGGRPLLLLFADYTCRNVCAPGLAMTASALAGSGLVPGRDWRLVVIGLDPRDTAADARRMASGLASLSEVARATALLTGDAESVTAATRVLGYAAVYDAGSGQFAHDAVVYAFGSDGRLRAVLPELGLTPATLRSALEPGEPEPTTGLIDHAARLCWGLAGAHGRFGGPILTALQALSALLLVGAGAWLLGRRRAR